LYTQSLKQTAQSQTPFFTTMAGTWHWTHLKKLVVFDLVAQQLQLP
jgi:hypothetical protein